MHPKGANKNNEDQAIFSNDGPNLIKPELTNNPSVIPKIYKLRNKKNNGMPNFKIEIPNTRFTLFCMNAVAAGALDEKVPRCCTELRPECNRTTPDGPQNTKNRLQRSRRISNLMNSFLCQWECHPDKLFHDVGIKTPLQELVVTPYS